MSKSKYKRKLTAILSADVVGYSRLMGDDEEFTIRTLNTCRDLMASLIKDHSGSVVDAVGDNLLAEFSSVVDAVQCAVNIQARLKKQNEKLPVSSHMLFRIGINIGDIIQEKERIYGDGVNIAARIESLAEAGGVCISRGAYDHIKKKLDFGYEYIGEHIVKNISDPVRVYKVLMDPRDAGKRINDVSVPLSKRSRSIIKKVLWFAASIVFILAVVCVGIYWKYIYLPAPADIDPEGKMEFNLPTGPSIAVLPFVNMSKDPEQDYFCDGITENIIAILAQTQMVLVIARNSVFAYKGKSMDVRQISRELKARYVMEGSIQKSNDRFRIVVQLIDTDTGHHIWAKRYDREFKDIFALQDEITLEILKAVGVKISVIAKNYPGVLQGISDIDSFIIIVKLREYYKNPAKERFAWALKSAQDIITSNPGYRYRYDILSTVYMNGALTGSCESTLVCLFRAADAIKTSLSLDADNWWAHQSSGYLFHMQKEYNKAIRSFKKAIELNPSSPESYVGVGWALIFLVKPLAALEYMDKAVRLDPVLSPFDLEGYGIAYRMLGEYEKAIDVYQRALKIRSDRWQVYLGLAVNYSLSGQDNNAGSAARELLKLNPEFSIEYFKKNISYKNQDQNDLLIDVYRKLGIPEKSE